MRLFSGSALASAVKSLITVRITDEEQGNNQVVDLYLVPK